MKKVADAFGQVHLVDWASKSEGKPWFSDYIGHLTSEGQRQLAITYLNRLSDLLFILGRVANPGGDVLWQPGGPSATPTT